MRYGKWLNTTGAQRRDHSWGLRLRGPVYLGACICARVQSSGMVHCLFWSVTSKVHLPVQYIYIYNIFKHVYISDGHQFLSTEHVCSKEYHMQGFINRPHMAMQLQIFSIFLAHLICFFSLKHIQAYADIARQQHVPKIKIDYCCITCPLSYKLQPLSTKYKSIKNKLKTRIYVHLRQ